MPPRPISRRRRNSPSRPAATPVIACAPETIEPVRLPGSPPRSSITSKAGKTARISSANSGCCSAYSSGVAGSPRRLRSMNSSARASTGLRRSLDVDMGSLFLRRFGRSVRSPHVGRSRLSSRLRFSREAGQRREDQCNPFRCPDVGLAGLGLRDAEDGGGLVVGELLAVAEREDLAVERVHGIQGLLEE